MEVLQELLDFRGARTVQLIFPEAEQHVNLKIKTSKIENILSTTHRYETTCLQRSNVQGAEQMSHQRNFYSPQTPSASVNGVTLE